MKVKGDILVSGDVRGIVFTDGVQTTKAPRLKLNRDYFYLNLVPENVPQLNLAHQYAHVDQSGASADTLRGTWDFKNGTLITPYDITLGNRDSSLAPTWTFTPVADVVAGTLAFDSGGTLGSTTIFRGASGVVPLQVSHNTTQAYLNAGDGVVATGGLIVHSESYAKHWLIGTGSGHQHFGVLVSPESGYQGHIYFNESRTATNFLVKQATNKYAFYVNSTNERIGMFAGTPQYDIDARGNLAINKVGKGLLVKEGSNATMGAATLVAGSATVSTTAVTANSRIFLTPQNTSGTAGHVSVSARSAGSNFTITSSSGTDTRSVAWMIVEPA